jgi:hypothetical protein
MRDAVERGDVVFRVSLKRAIVVLSFLVIAGGIVAGTMTFLGYRRVDPTGQALASLEQAQKETQAVVTDLSTSRMQQEERLQYVEQAVEFVSWRACRDARNEGGYVPPICLRIEREVRERRRIP